jgi:phage repressor protein C with HTH and peptisase S24 domain
VVRVKGDSMAPTLADGDDILVDGADGADRLRDGLYVLRVEEALVVKRLALSPLPGRVSILSDNEGYPDWRDWPVSDVDIVGRVVWFGRRL